MNPLNYHHLYYFYTVCQERGFTKAALKLRISQSAMSEQVRKLEEILGQKLIERTTRRFELTENGKMAQKYAETIFGAGQELVEFMLHRPERGTQLLRVGALSTLSKNFQLQFLKPILDRKDVSFDLLTGDSKRLLKLLRNHEIDIILSTYPVSEADAGQCYTHPLMESPLCIVSRDLRKAKKDPEDVLKSERIYLPSRTFESRAEFDYWVEHKRISLQVAGQVEAIAFLRLLALTTEALVLIPRMGVMHDLENKNLCVVHEFTRMRQKYYAITRQKKQPNPLIAELIHSSRMGSPC